MDFLDPKKRRAALIRLILGYILLGIALILTTIILLYQAYGFGIKNGQVIQSGLVFVSSQPSPAQIFINGQLNTSTTNTRLLLPAGQYTLQLQRSGYRIWLRAMTVEGGVVEHFDYPFLFPTNLVTKVTQKFATPPPVAAQSPDRRWLLVEPDATAYGTFALTDLSHPTVAPTSVVIPQNIFSLTTGTSSWQVIQWSNDNQHVLLKHITTNGATQASEYIMVDTQNPQASFNLTKLLGVNPTTIQLNNNLYNSYFLYSQPNQTLMTATQSNPQPQPLLSNVLGFQAHGSSTILYATSLGAPAGKAYIKLLYGGQTYTIRGVTISPTYILNLTQYNGAWYVVAGSPADSRTYVYKNPMQTVQTAPKGLVELPAPVEVFTVPSPNFAAFSANAQLVMVENGTQVGVYDAQTNRAYAYHLVSPIDPPQPNVTWMDGNRLVYVSNGKVVVVDYDNTNHQVLNEADPSYSLLFDSSYKFLYTFGQMTTKDATGAQTSQFSLNNTALLIPSDQ